MEDALVKEFVDFYYQAFDTDRSKLATLYRDESCLTFEGASVVGTQAISQKFMSLAFKSSRHKLQSVDHQLTPNGGILVFVTGQILPEGESHPLKFSQVFHGFKMGNAFVLSNDMFRLNMA